MLESWDRAAGAAALAAFGGSAGVDWAMRALIDVDLLRFGPLVALLAYASVAPHGRIEARPERLLRSLAGILLAVAASRILQALLPERPRPRYAPNPLPFPDLGHLEMLRDWSSFPSDSAALGFALVGAVAALARPALAWACAAWALVVVCYPRLHIGYHHLSDLLAGAALGLAAVALAQWLPLLRGPCRGMRRLMERHPAAAVAGLVLVGYELVSAFRSLRQAQAVVRDLAAAFAG